MRVFLAGVITLCICLSCDEWFFDEKPGEWEYVTEFPAEGREQAISFTLSDSVYIGLGHAFYRDESGRITDTANFNDFWIFIPETTTWRKLSDFPRENVSTGLGFSVGERGYTILNLDDKNTVWEYNPAEDAWYKLSEFPGFLRKGAVGFTLNDKIYFGLGSYYDTIIHERIDATDLWMYDPELDIWQEKEVFPGPPRNNAATFTICNKAFVCTGSEPPFNFDNMRDSWEYDPDRDTWTKKKDFGGYARHSAVAFAMNNKGYIGAGTMTHTVRNTGIDFWEYNNEMDSWRRIANYPAHPSNAVGFVIQNTCYLGLGNNGRESYSNSIYKLTIDN